MQEHLGVERHEYGAWGGVIDLQRSFEFYGLRVKKILHIFNRGATKKQMMDV